MLSRIFTQNFGDSVSHKHSQMSMEQVDMITAREREKTENENVWKFPHTKQRHGISLKFPQSSARSLLFFSANVWWVWCERRGRGARGGKLADKDEVNVALLPPHSSTFGVEMLCVHEDEEKNIVYVKWSHNIHYADGDKKKFLLTLPLCTFHHHTTHSLPVTNVKNTFFHSFHSTHVVQRQHGAVNSALKRFEHHTRRIVFFIFLHFSSLLSSQCRVSTELGNYIWKFKLSLLLYEWNAFCWEVQRANLKDFQRLVEQFSIFLLSLSLSRWKLKRTRASRKMRRRPTWEK